MTLPLLVLVHGWGFDGRFWDGLRRALGDPEAVVVELGFFGPSRLELPPPGSPPGRPVLAVGHSLGVLWLLETRRLPWVGLVSINGFDRFCAGPEFPAGVASRPLERMQARFEADPGAVTAEFRTRCGCFDPLPGEPVADRLGAGLARLRDGDTRAVVAGLDLPLLALSGDADPILPAGMDAACFAGGRRVTRVSRAGGGHLLPLAEPAWCAAEIARWAAVALPEGSVAA